MDIPRPVTDDDSSVRRHGLETERQCCWMLLDIGFQCIPAVLRGLTELHGGVRHALFVDQPRDIIDLTVVDNPVTLRLCEIPNVEDLVNEFLRDTPDRFLTPHSGIECIQYALGDNQLEFRLYEPELVQNIRLGVWPVGRCTERGSEKPISACKINPADRVQDGCFFIRSRQIVYGIAPEAIHATLDGEEIYELVHAIRRGDAVAPMLPGAFGVQEPHYDIPHRAGIVVNPHRLAEKVVEKWHYIWDTGISDPVARRTVTEIFACPVELVQRFGEKVSIVSGPCWHMLGLSRKNQNRHQYKHSE